MRAASPISTSATFGSADWRGHQLGPLSAVAAAGDVNADGYDDVIVGTGASLSYVVFGSADGLPPSIDRTALPCRTRGFSISGADPTLLSADKGEIASAGMHINGDGSGRCDGRQQRRGFRLRL